MPATAATCRDIGLLLPPRATAAAASGTAAAVAARRTSAVAPLNAFQFMRNPRKELTMSRYLLLPACLTQVIILSRKPAISYRVSPLARLMFPGHINGTWLDIGPHTHPLSGDLTYPPRQISTFR
jgi:hypothetical protein